MIWPSRRHKTSEDQEKGFHKRAKRTGVGFQKNETLIAPVIVALL
jgi:hypothetical protein